MLPITKKSRQLKELDRSARELELQIQALEQHLGSAPAAKSMTKQRNVLDAPDRLKFAEQSKRLDVALRTSNYNTSSDLKGNTMLLVLLLGGMVAVTVWLYSLLVQA